jgi:hypothetical protein
MRVSDGNHCNSRRFGCQARATADEHIQPFECRLPWEVHIDRFEMDLALHWVHKDPVVHTFPEGTTCNHCWSPESLPLPGKQPSGSGNGGLSYLESLRLV